MGRLAAGGLLLVCAVGCMRAPPEFTSHLQRGEAHLASGDPALALSAFQHARELRPEDPQVQRALMRARLHLLAEDPSRLAPAGIADARYEASVLMETAPSHAATWLTALGHLERTQGQEERARARYEEALNADPASAVAHTALALLEEEKNALDALRRARAGYEAALQANPRSQVALQGLGRVLLALDEPATAAEKLRAALDVGENLQARLLLARALMRLEKQKEAVPHYRRARVLDPGNLEAMTGLGQALLGSGNAAEAEQVLRAALRVHDDAAVHTALGFSLLQQHKDAQALEVFEQVLARAPGTAGALLGAGLAQEALGRVAEAEARYREVLKVPLEGAQRDVTLAMQRDAQERLAKLIVQRGGGQ